MTEVKNQNFDFQIAGTTSDNKIMVLVDDHIYGKAAYIIGDVDEHDRVTFEMVKTFVEAVPEERQDRILTSILEQIITESRDL
jgi:hypothetical protein